MIPCKCEHGDVLEEVSDVSVKLICLHLRVLALIYQCRLVRLRNHFTNIFAFPPQF